MKLLINFDFTLARCMLLLRRRAALLQASLFDIQLHTLDSHIVLHMCFFTYDDHA